MASILSRPQCVKYINVNFENGIPLFGLVGFDEIITIEVMKFQASLPETS